MKFIVKVVCNLQTRTYRLLPAFVRDVGLICFCSTANAGGHVTTLDHVLEKDNPAGHCRRRRSRTGHLSIDRCSSTRRIFAKICSEIERGFDTPFGDGKCGQYTNQKISALLILL